MVKEYIVNSKTHGRQVIILDDDVYAKIIKNNMKIWINYAPTVHGCYAIFYKDGKRTRLHRWITDCPKGLQVDHINHNTLDNRRENLRIVTHFENMQNRQDNKVGKVGIYWSNRDKTYVVEFKGKYVGQSRDLSSAIQMRLSAEQKGKATIV